MQALHGSGVAVPRVHALCEDTSLLGATFFVMDYVEGRIFYDQRLPRLSPAERSAIFDDMNRLVANLHRIDPAAVGLERYGRPENFLQRQIDLPWKNWSNSEESPLGMRIGELYGTSAVYAGADHREAA